MILYNIYSIQVTSNMITQCNGIGNINISSINHKNIEFNRTVYTYSYKFYV